MSEREALIDRLRLHAYELVHGGAVVSQLQADLRSAADLLAAERPRDDAAPPLSCALCGEAFAEKADLKLHALLRHRIGDDQRSDGWEPT